jgi:hypothetical protein
MTSPEDLKKTEALFWQEPFDAEAVTSAMEVLDPPALLSLFNVLVDAAKDNTEQRTRLTKANQALAALPRYNELMLRLHEWRKTRGRQ